MGVIVTKFGGSSLADAGQFQKVKNILLADERRRFVVPSAPGKREEDDEKVTDMLYACHDRAALGENVEAVFDRLRGRYLGISQALGLSLDMNAELDKVFFALQNGQTRDFAASRGEFLSGMMLANYLGWEFIDAAEVICFDNQGVFDQERTQELLSRRLAGVERAVIPGFYGSLPNGKVKTFSRGGSDISGAIVARAAGAELYENWTDVPGFLMADPRIV